MASTYSDLKIELIGTGEQVGTWGATTNTNLGTALEEAITGSADVTFSSADVTLTLSNTNGTQTARNLRLVCTGTSGGARNLILGSGCQINKLYLVQNDLADTVTVKNTTGTGVAVPAGGKRFVFNDGTNVVEAININLASGISGTLPVVNGGTGQTSYTDGQLLIGTTAGSTLTKATLTGTANRLTVTNGSGSITLNVDATDANTASKVVARDASGNFSAGVVTADLTGDVTGDVTGDLFGNADTATALETARTIGGVSFDGTADIDLPGVNTSGNQDTSGSSASCSGNAATATTLQTTRTINNTNFNGSANITVRTSVENASNNAEYELALVPGTSTDIFQVYATSASPTVNASTGALTAAGGVIGNASTATALSTAGGSAPSYSARAWVNFDGDTAGVNPATMTMRGNGNVSSVTRTATGKFRINFSTAMPSDDYAVIGTHGNSTNAGGLSAISTSSAYAEIETRFGNALDNPEYVSIVVFN